MRIAYIILAHKNPLQVARMLQALNHHGASFFVHVDKVVPVDPFVAALMDGSVSAQFVSDRQNVLWGGYSMIQATINTIMTAKASGPHDYFVLLSGSDYPIRSADNFLAELESGHEYINRHRMPADHVGKPISRLKHPYRASKNPDRIPDKAFNALLRLIPMCDYREVLGNLVPHGGSQWWCLSQACVDYILRTMDDRSEVVKFFTRIKIPDEIMFHTLLSQSPFEEKVRPAMMFTAWEPGGRSPCTLRAGHVPQMRESGKHFARKFDLESDPGLFDLIDHQLRR